MSPYFGRHDPGVAPPSEDSLPTVGMADRSGLVAVGRVSLIGYHHVPDAAHHFVYEAGPYVFARWAAPLYGAVHCVLFSYS